MKCTRMTRRAGAITHGSRRKWLIGAAGIIVAMAAGAARQLLPTPAQMIGPFYPEEPPLDQDNDLTRVNGTSGRAQGTMADLSGRLLDVNGAPIRASRIEIWQCDARGLYHHPRDRAGERDEKFQGFGHTITDRDGRYRFRTIKPVPYPGRTPHIHFAVRPDFDEPFVTQLYVQGEPGNARDGLYNALRPEQRPRVTTAFAAVGEKVVATFDIILGVTPAG